MTRDRNFARLVRARMRLTGERYTTARTALAASVAARPSPRESERHSLAPLTPQYEGTPVTGPQQVAAALYEAVNTEDFNAVRALLAADVIGKVSDIVQPVREHVGADALLDHFRRRRALGEGSYRIDSWTFEDHPQPASFAAVLVRHSAVFAGERVTSETLHILRAEEGRIALLGASLPAGEVDGRWLGLVA